MRLTKRFINADLRVYSYYPRIPVFYVFGRVLFSIQTSDRLNTFSVVISCVCVTRIRRILLLLDKRTRRDAQTVWSVGSDTLRPEQHTCHTLICLSVLCTRHPDILYGISLCPGVRLATLALKPEHSSAHTLLFGGRITGNALVLLQVSSTKDSYRFGNNICPS